VLLSDNDRQQATIEICRSIMTEKPPGSQRPTNARQLIVMVQYAQCAMQK